MQEKAKKHILSSFAKKLQIYLDVFPRKRSLWEERPLKRTLVPILCEDMLALKAFPKFSSFFVSDDKDA